MASRVSAQKKKQSAGLCEQYRQKKKKKLDSSARMLRLRSCTYLEQNAAHTEDVENKEQVGLTWMNMTAFVDSIPKSQSDLADVISVSEEIFHLDSLSEVLSYEVWTKCLTGSERKLLMQFLPSGTGAEQAVRSLLMGENHHFGSPFLRWSTSLCSGNLHPDAVRHMSHELISSRRTYYSELNEYHTVMLDVLGRWKERWIICKDPEKLLSEGPIRHDQNSFNSKARGKETFPNSTRKNRRSLQNSTRRLNAPKGGLPPIICIHHNGNTKHTSHIKISTEQYEMIKKLKPSDSGITLFKSLSHVLGDIKFPHANKISEEEEKRVRERWAQLATKVIPTAFKYHREKKLQRENWGKSLEQELAEKRRSIMDMDEKTKTSASSPQEQVSTGDYANPTTEMMLIPKGDYSTLNSEKDCYSHRVLSDQVLSLHVSQELSPVISASKAMEEFAPRPPSSPHFSQFLGKRNPREDTMRPVSSFSFPEDGSQGDNTQDFFYRNAPMTHGYAYTAEVSLNQPRPFQPIQEYSIPFINLGGTIPEEARSSTIPYSLSHSHGQHTSSMTNNSFLELGQFSREFQGPSQVREKDLYMHQTKHTNTFRNSRYRGQHSYNDALVGHNWFLGEVQACNDWSEISQSVSSDQYSGDNGCSGGNHYSIPSGCSMNLPCTMNYIRDVNPSDGIHKQFTHQHKIVSCFDLPGHSSSLNNVSKMNSLNQSPVFADSIGRTFPNYRNQ